MGDMLNLANAFVFTSIPQESGMGRNDWGEDGGFAIAVATAATGQ